jgi:hypothetical protein
MFKTKSLLIISSIAFCSLIVVLASEYHIFQKDVLTRASTASNSVAAVADSATTATDATPAPKTYEFKLATNADECVLNKLGTDGWQPIQYGTPSIINAQTGCSKRGNVSTWVVYDWILMQRDGR